jgi:hypothetical protein
MHAYLPATSCARLAAPVCPVTDPIACSNRYECAAICAVIVSATADRDAPGQNRNRNVSARNREFRRDSRKADGPETGLANRRLQPLGHLTAARNLSRRQASSYGNAAEVHIVPEIVPASFQDPPRKAGDRASKSADQKAPVLSPTTIAAAAWPAPLYSHEPASTYLVGRASWARRARGSGAQTSRAVGAGLSNRRRS